MTQKRCRIRFAGTVLMLCVGSLLSGGACAASETRPIQIVAGPWLQLSEVGNMAVCWLTDRPSTGEVAYGEGLAKKAHASQYGLKEASELHRVTLTGLAPGTQVSYQVTSREIRRFNAYNVQFGESVTSAPSAFHVPDPNAEQVSFALFSDLHESTKLLPDLVRVTDAKHRDFVVFDGDFFNSVDTEEQVVSRFLQPVSREFASEVPFVFVRGNHDARGAYARRLPEYLSLPGNPFVSSFKIGPAAMLVLDTGEDKPDDHREYSGLVDFSAWRAEETGLLEGLVSAEAWKSASFRVLLAHVPDVSQWHALLDKAGLDLQIAGHYHSLEFQRPPGTFPVLIASGDARQSPDSYPAAVVTITREAIDLDMITRTGEHPGHWTLPVRKTQP